MGSHGVRRMLFLSLLVSLVLTGSTTTAVADRPKIFDGNDTRSRLDIKRFLLFHVNEQLAFRINAYRDWEPSDLGRGRIVFSINIDDDPRIERKAVIEFVRREFRPLVPEVQNGRGEPIGRGHIRRPTDRSVEIRLPRWQLGHSDTIRTSVAVIGGRGACGHRCRDRAPDRGSVTHVLQPICWNQEPTIIGTEGDDYLRGTESIDIIAGLGGDDVIRNLRGGDVVCGGPGDDDIRGGRGHLHLEGGDGNDRIEGTGPEPCPPPLDCIPPQAHLFGGPGDDILLGGDEQESLLGEGGNDVLYGRRDVDYLYGGPGRDTLRGGPGKDYCKQGERNRSC
jgi:hypothetical protein